MSDALKLANEYRPTMTGDVLHSWAVDAVGALHRQDDEIERLRAQVAALSAPAPAPAEAAATVTECEACFTPDVCQLRGTCDHYAAERLRVARQEADALAKWGDWTMLPLIATEPMQKAMQRAVMLRKSINDVWRAAIGEAPESPVSAPDGEPDWSDVLAQARPCKGMNCGATDGVSHSLECHAEHAAANAGGTFTPGAPPAAQAQLTPRHLMHLLEASQALELSEEERLAIALAYTALSGTGAAAQGGEHVE